METVLRKHGYIAAVICNNYDKTAEIEAVRYLYNSGAEGIIICSVCSVEVYDNYLQGLNMPIVSPGNLIPAIAFMGIGFCRNAGANLGISQIQL